MSILTTGSKYINNFPDFVLKGRDSDLERVSSVLLRSKANSIILTGSDGVGCSSIALGLQKSKEDPNAPSDIVNKRFFWLDTNALFANGNTDVGSEFRKIINELKRSHNSVVIIEDSKDFIESAGNSGSMYFINALSMGIRNGDFQAILETKDEDLSTVLRVHSDFRELFTLISVDEPFGESLEAIVKSQAEQLSKFHKIKISDEAVYTAIELTSKYQTRDASLSRAQPERTITLIDRAFSSYRLDAHKTRPEKFTAEEWETLQRAFKRYNNELREGEEQITALEEDLENQLNEEKNVVPPSDAQVAPEEYKGMDQLLQSDSNDSQKVRAIKSDIRKYQKIVETSKSKYDELTAKINAHLEVTREHVLTEFSDISGISTSKLNQNEIEKLKTLEAGLRKRIFGQDEAVGKLANAVKIARVGRRNKNKPQAAFMFLGPSGVGKTEIAKALSASLLDDEKALTRFDMSEYMEKHAVAKLIGAPPGYEGFEAGGILTNLMRKNGNRVLLFDEIEKGHPDIFNLFLQILSDGRLTDNLGRTASFEDSIIIMTTNIGQKYFLDTGLSRSEMDAGALQELSATFRPELLNRFAGRQNIVCFNRLELDSIKKIVSREFTNLNNAYADRGITINISDDELENFCSAIYNPVEGARGLPGYIEAYVEPVIVNSLLDNPELSGVITVSYSKEYKKLNVKIA